MKNPFNFLKSETPSVEMTEDEKKARALKLAEEYKIEYEANNMERAMEILEEIENLQPQIKDLIKILTR